MSAESMDDILRDVDQDGDGRIDYNEFVALMRGFAAGNGLMDGRTGPVLKLSGIDVTM